MGTFSEVRTTQERTLALELLYPTVGISGGGSPLTGLALGRLDEDELPDVVGVTQTGGVLALFGLGG